MMGAKRRHRIAALILAAGAAVTLAQHDLAACTAFCATTKDGAVLVGNNEDFYNPRTRIQFIPARPGSYGRLYVGYDDLYPQGGMNERGLWFDGFGTPAVKPRLDRPSYPGNIVADAMATCATVEEVVQLFSRYNRAFLTEGILMFADATGDAVSIEANAIVRKTRRHFVQTNFHQSRTHTTPDARFKTATAMLDGAGGEVSVDLFRRILDATHQEGGAPTLYSNIYDLRSRKMYLYLFHDYERVVTIDLTRELEKGERVVEIPSLFPRNAKEQSFTSRHPKEPQLSSAPMIAGLVAVGVVLIAAAVFGLLRATRGVRRFVGVAVALIVAAAAGLVAIVERSSRPGHGPWIQFSIAPASGQSVSISSNALRSNGISLKLAIATAFDIPSVRVVGPDWLNHTRYAINATVDVDEAGAFRQALRQELEQRLHLATHVEQRPFDVFVLSAIDRGRLEPGAIGSGIQIGVSGMHVRGATLETLASALQGVVGRPVIDRTGIEGTYNLQVDWGKDRIADVTAALRERFGLALTREQVELDALIVDEIRRDPSLVVLAQAGRAVQWAPASIRAQLSELLTIR
jgi:uncharacterized protein (TIGR03435 family)